MRKCLSFAAALLLVLIMSGAVYAADDEGMIFGTIEEYSTWSPGVILKDSLYYLNASLEVTGHSVPDGFSFTINGQKPEGDISVSAADGKYKVK